MMVTTEHNNHKDMVKSRGYLPSRPGDSLLEFWEVQGINMGVPDWQHMARFI